MRIPDFWSEYRDSNPRPLGPEPSAIPNFAIPRKRIYYNEKSIPCQALRDFFGTDIPLISIIDCPEVMRMGYRIVYGPDRMDRQNGSTKRLGTMIAGSLLAFLALTAQFWPAGRAKLEEVLLPGDPAVTKQAFSVMTEQLRAGEAIGDAVAAFCQEVMDGAEAVP